MRRKRKERERQSSLINKGEKKKRVDLSFTCSMERTFSFIPAGESQSQTKERTECIGWTADLISKSLQSEGQKSHMSSQSAQRNGENVAGKTSKHPAFHAGPGR